MCLFNLNCTHFFQLKFIENGSDWSRKRSEHEKIKICEVDSVLFGLCSGWEQFLMPCNCISMSTYFVNTGCQKEFALCFISISITLTFEFRWFPAKKSGAMLLWSVPCPSILFLHVMLCTHLTPRRVLLLGIRSIVLAVQVNHDMSVI